MGYGSEEKKDQTVEISMDGFVETLEALRDDNEFRFGDEYSTNAAITEVKTVEDFCYWRGLRAANASASLHKKEEKEGQDV